jgi:hypothetical protein
MIALVIRFKSGNSRPANPQTTNRESGQCGTKTGFEIPLSFNT